MTKYIIKRILIAIPVLLGITVIDYAIMCMAGSPLEMLQGPRVSEAAVQAKAIALGLDKPFYVQYFVWLGQLLHGNMGYSIKNYQPVAAMITSHLGPTLLLMGVSLLVSILLAVPAGIYSAIHQYSKGDYTVVTLSFLGSSIPGFFLAMLLIYLFSFFFRLHIFIQSETAGRTFGHQRTDDASEKYHHYRAVQYIIIQQAFSILHNDFKTDQHCCQCSCGLRIT